MVRMALAVVAALAFMALDARLHMGTSVRSVVATVLTPLQWLSAQPVKTINLMDSYVVTAETAKQTQEQAVTLLAQQALRAQRADNLIRENEQLRQLLGLHQALQIQARAAEVVYIAADPFIRRVVIDKGSSQGLQLGAPVIDPTGLVGQISRVHPMSAEVTLIDNPQQATPVINGRTGERYLVYGDRQTLGGLEVRFTSPDADVQVGDVLATSGTGGVYPAGLPVGTIAHINHRNTSSFVQVLVAPSAHTKTLRHVLVLDPQPLTQNEAVQQLILQDKGKSTRNSKAPATRPGVPDGSVKEP